MSYARFGEGGSDVYVYGNADGHLTCSACALNGSVEADPESILGVSFPPSWNTPTAGLPYDRVQPDRRLPVAAYDEMLAHLVEHYDAGHHVPERAMTRLHRERDEAQRYEMEQ